MMKTLWIIFFLTFFTIFGENRWDKILNKIPKNEKESAFFLWLNMEDNDKNNLSEIIFLENLKYAYLAREKFPWAKKLEQSIFFNAVLPYAVIDETRENWRPQFFETFSKLVQEKKCQTAAEAATIINKKIKEILQVEYSTKRVKANQSPSESMQQKMASCTGLSILLINAFRAVGIPARMVGVCSWANKKGNHNWVEVFFDGKWNFTEYYFDSQGFNHGWFVDDCGLLNKDVPENNIWATSFEKSTEKFPAVWTKSENWFTPGINRTDVYTSLKKNKNKNSEKKISIKAVDKEGNRIAINFSITQENKVIFQGKTCDKFADMNNITAINLLPGNYQITYINLEQKNISKNFTIDKNNVVYDIKF